MSIESVSRFVRSVRIFRRDRTTKLERENEALKVGVRELRQCLTSRDGGDHAVDCKHWKGRCCTCGHNAAVLLLAKTKEGVNP